MKKIKITTSIIVSLVFLWIGFVGAISFMEAWLKFRAPGVTLELGLGIGNLVFKALNGVEIVFASLILIFMIWRSLIESNRTFSVWIGIALFVLLIESFWLLPSLGHRAESIIHGVDVEKIDLHILYISAEILKVGALFIYGGIMLKSRM